MTYVVYSKGPWTLVKAEQDIYKRIIAGDGRTIAQIEEGDTPEKVWGNGFLLANADALYEASVALREAQKAYMQCRGDDEKGREVARCAANLDTVIERIQRGDYEVEQ